MRNARTAVAVIILVAAIGALSFISVVRRQKPTLPPEKIVIANIGPYSVFNIIAKEKGFFLENGLEAQVDEYDSGATSMAALLSGKADVAVAADFVGVVNMFKNRDIRVIANVSSHQVFRVIARRDSAVAAPSDLKGKRIGVTRKTHGEFFLDRFLLANGLGMNDVEKVDLDPTSIKERFREGALDAAIIFEPHAYAMEKEYGNSVISWPAQRGRDAMALIYSTQVATERRSQVIGRYLRSIIMADRYLKEHEAEARALVAEALKYDAAYEAYLWPKFHFYVGLRQEMLLGMEEQARFLIANGMTDDSPVPDYLDMIYFDGLEAEDPSAVSIVH